MMMTMTVMMVIMIFMVMVRRLEIDLREGGRVSVCVCVLTLLYYYEEVSKELLYIATTVRVYGIGVYGEAYRGVYIPCLYFPL